MPRFVALDWDDQHVRAVLANQQGASLTVDDAVTVALDSSETGSETQDLARAIRKAVRDRRYRSAEAVITIPRADVELRLLSLPPVPDEELPDIVRFQAMQEFSEVSQDWPIDYLKIEASSDEVTVLAATASTARIEEYRKTAEQVDLKAYSLVLRPCAAASLVEHRSDVRQKHVQLMVDELGGSMELTVLKDQTAIFIRTVQQPTASNRLNHLSGEIRRTIVAAQHQLGGDLVEQVILFGSGAAHEEFCESLQEKLQLTVQSIDPFHGLQLSRELLQHKPEDSGRFAAALGLLVNQVDARAALLDFFNPRRVKPPKSKRPMIVASIVTAATILMLIVGGCWWYMGTLDNSILATQRKTQNQRAVVEAAQKRIDEHRAVADWLRRDINWLDELRDVSNDLPSAQKAMVRDLRAAVVTSGNGVITLEGVVDQQQTISELERALRDETHRVQGEGGRKEQRVKDYPWRFKETVVIQTGDPNDKSRADSNRPSRSRPPRRAAQ